MLLSHNNVSWEAAQGIYLTTFIYGKQALNISPGAMVEISWGICAILGKHFALPYPTPSFCSLWPVELQAAIAMDNTII